MTFLAAVTGSTQNNVEPGVLGFLVVAGIGVVLVFLLRSMNKHLKKIPPPEDPDQAGDQEQAKGQETAAAAQATEARGAKRG